MVTVERPSLQVNDVSVPPAGDARGRIARLRPRLATIGVALVALALAGAVGLVLGQRRTALDQARIGAENLALVLAGQTTRSVQAVDVMLRDLQHHADDDAGDPGALRAALAGDSFAALLRQDTHMLPLLEGLVVADADGRVLAAAGPLPAARQVAAGHDAARHFAADPADALFICAPTLDPARPDPGAHDPDTWTMYLARRIALPGGQVVAILVAALRLEAFGSLYGGLRLPGDGLVALLRTDGTLLLRRPAFTDNEPRRVPPDAPWFNAVAHGGGSYRSAGVFDAARRVIAAQPLRNYPLVAVVGVDEAAALAVWRRDSALIGGGAAAATACILLLLLALLRQFRLVERSQASLEAVNENLSRKSRELEMTLAHMDQGLMMVNADGTVAVCNRRATEMLALPPALMESRPTFEQVLAYQWTTDEFRHTAPDLQGFIRAGGILDQPQTYERRRPNGRVIEVRSVPLEGGGMVRTYTDTTARALSEERFRQIVDDSPLAIALVSAEQIFVQVNPACCALVGRSAEALVGRSWQDIVHPDDRPSLQAAPPSPGGGPVVVEARLVTAAGTVVWTRLTRSRLATGPGRPPLILAIGEDVTPQREMEARLRQTQRLEAVGQLTGGVAHDFNNLLGVIMLNAEALADALEHDPARARLANEILTTASSGAELTRRLLAFARRQSLQPRAMDLNDYIGDAVTLLRRTLGGTIAVKLSLAPGLWPLRADASQVGDALLNLALNARDAMGAGGTLTIGTANLRVGEPDAEGRGGAPADLPPGDYVALTVSDTGAGMTAEVLERAMEPFFTTKPPGAGSGLGLSMIYGFARQSGGALVLESVPGSGTSVHLLLPRAPEGAATDPAEVPDGDLPGGRESVLLVDDNEAIRRSAARLLASLGYAVLEARDGPSALEVLRSATSVNLLFTDLVMPGGMNGSELAQAARDLRPGLRVLFTTGFARAGEDGAEPGPVLRKPYRRQAIAEQVRAALDA